MPSYCRIALLPPNQVWSQQANILINQEGNACLADFGLLTIFSDPKYATASSLSADAGTTRWMSPELLNPAQFDLPHGQPTKESDCYALGMVILEVLSGQVPFPNDSSWVVMQRVLKGEHPERPVGALFVDGLWGMLELCWNTQPKSRPSVETVLKYFMQVSWVWEQPSTPGDEDSVGTDEETEVDVV